MVSIIKHLRHIDTSDYSFANQKNLKVMRCYKCNMLFQSFKDYHRMTCLLCRYETSIKFFNKCKENQKKRGRDITIESESIRLLKIHKEFERRMRNDYKARGVKCTNTPVCKRLS